MGKDHHMRTHVRTYSTYSRPIAKYSILPLRLNFDEYSGLYGSCMPSSSYASLFCVTSSLTNQIGELQSDI